jgi:hypothetical protein
MFPFIFILLLFIFTNSLFTGLLGQKDLFFLESSCLTLVSASVCKGPLIFFCSAGLVDMNFFSSSLLWMVLISQSISKDSFDELTNLS